MARPLTSQRETHQSNHERQCSAASGSLACEWNNVHTTPVRTTTILRTTVPLSRSPSLPSTFYRSILRPAACWPFSSIWPYLLLLHSSPPSFLSSLERQIHIRPPLPPPSPPPSSGGSQRVLHSAIVPFCRFIPCRFSSSSSRPFFVLPFTWSASNDSSLFFNTVYPSFGLSSRLVLAFYVSIIANTFRSLAFPSSITSNRTVLRFGIDTL